MAVNKHKDPTEPIRLKASLYPAVAEGTACTQSAFKTSKRAFLYVGMQGGRYKAMFKLQQSMSQATKLAKDNPDNYEIGLNGWVTARFTADKPMPKRLWEKWLDESYQLSLAGGGKTTSRKETKSKATSKKKQTAKAKSKARRK